MTILMIRNDPPYGSERVTREGGEVQACGSSMDELAASTVAADKVLIF